MIQGTQTGIRKRTARQGHVNAETLDRSQCQRIGQLGGELLLFLQNRLIFMQDQATLLNLHKNVSLSEA